MILLSHNDDVKVKFDFLCLLQTTRTKRKVETSAAAHVRCYETMQTSKCQQQQEEEDEDGQNT
jgi:hypothetical protein